MNPSWLLAALLLAGACGQATEPSAPPAAAKLEVPTVGMEGRLEVTLPGALLEARPVDEKSLIILRVAETFPHGALTRYDLRYIGLEPGRYDLRDYLRRPDGSPPGELPLLPVESAGLLPKTHSGELVERPLGVLGLFGGYRNALVAAGVVWIAGLVAFWFGRRHRSSATAAPVTAPPPSLAERLRPLVELAARGQLPAEGKAQLERLLLTHWRERLALGDLDPAEAIARLRPHPEAGRLLTALEDWLHRPPGTTRVDVNALLAPYRDVPESHLHHPANGGAASHA